MSSTIIEIPFSSGNTQAIRLSIKKLVIKKDGEDVYEIAIKNDNNEIASFLSEEGAEYFTMDYVPDSARLKLLECRHTNDLIGMMRKWGLSGNIMAAYVAQKTGVEFIGGTPDRIQNIGPAGYVVCCSSLIENSSSFYVVCASSFIENNSSFFPSGETLNNSQMSTIDIPFSSGSGETIQFNIKEADYERRNKVTYWVAIKQPEEYGRQLVIKVPESALLPLKDIDTNNLIEILKEWGREGAESAGNRMAAYVAKKTGVPFLPSSDISSLYRSLPLTFVGQNPIPMPTPAPSPRPRQTLKKQIPIPFAEGSDQHITLIIEGYDAGGTHWLKISGCKGSILLSPAELIDFLDGVKSANNLLEKLEKCNSNINPTYKIMDFIRQKIAIQSDLLTYDREAYSRPIPISTPMPQLFERKMHVPFTEGSDQHITLIIRKENNNCASLRISGWDEDQYILLSPPEVAEFRKIKDARDLLEELKKHDAGDMGRFIMGKMTQLDKYSNLLTKENLIYWYGSVISMPTETSTSGIRSGYTFLAPKPTGQPIATELPHAGEEKKTSVTRTNSLCILL